jgi:hypothetical protein
LLSKESRCYNDGLTSFEQESDESDRMSASLLLDEWRVVFVATDFLAADFTRTLPESDEEISALP